MIQGFQKYIIHGYLLQRKPSRTSLYLEDTSLLPDHPAYSLSPYLLNFIMPTYYIFLETSGQIQLTGGNSRYHDHHQEDQECGQECPPSMGMSLVALIATNTHVSYIFGILKQNVVDW